MVGVKQAVVMVGGKGTRLKPLTDTCPKPILPVLDRPCLDYLIESLVNAGVKHIILACGYKSEQVPKSIGDGSDRGIKIEYSYEDVPMGTAGAIKLLEDRLDEVFIAANGDLFAESDITGQINEHFRTDACITIALTPVENPCEFGIAKVGDDGRILEFKEKPKPEEVFSNLVNAGIYVVNKSVMKLVPKGQMHDFSKDLVIELIRRGRRIQSHTMNGLWRDVGRPSDLLGTNMIMAEKKGNHPTSSYAGIGSKISDSELTSAIVSKDAEIEGSKITESMVMEGSKISDSELFRSIIGKNCTISDCVLHGVVLGDGTVMTGKIVSKSSECAANK